MFSQLVIINKQVSPGGFGYPGIWVQLVKFYITRQFFIKFCYFWETQVTCFGSFRYIISKFWILRELGFSWKKMGVSFLWYSTTSPLPLCSLAQWELLSVSFQYMLEGYMAVKITVLGQQSNMLWTYCTSEIKLMKHKNNWPLSLLLQQFMVVLGKVMSSLIEIIFFSLGFDFYSGYGLSTLLQTHASNFP